MEEHERGAEKLVAENQEDAVLGDEEKVITNAAILMISTIRAGLINGIRYYTTDGTEMRDELEIIQRMVARKQIVVDRSRYQHITSIAKQAKALMEEAGGEAEKLLKEE